VRLLRDDVRSLEVRPLSVRDMLLYFGLAVRELKSSLGRIDQKWQDVPIRAIAEQIDWWVDADGDVFGRSWTFGLLFRSDRSLVPEEETAMWDDVEGACVSVSDVR
jgi:hypothetical protein